MRKIILYIACSLDGKIADTNGSTDWLHQIPNPDTSDYGYAKFFKSIDTTIMGNATYQQVLGFDVEFPYKQTENYVITRNKSLTRDEHVQYVSENIVGFINDLKNKPGKDIWSIGGAALNGLLLEHGLLDEIQIFTMPVILGKGIPLTSQLNKNISLKLINTTTYKSDVLEMRYKVINDEEIG